MSMSFFDFELGAENCDCCQSALTACAAGIAGNPLVSAVSLGLVLLALMLAYAFARCCCRCCQQRQEALGPATPSARSYAVVVTEDEAKDAQDSDPEPHPRSSSNPTAMASTDNIMRILIDMPDSDVQKVVQQLFSKRQHLFDHHAAHDATISRALAKHKNLVKKRLARDEECGSSSCDQAPTDVSNISLNHQVPEDVETPSTRQVALPVVSFLTQESFVMEQEGYVYIDVVRMGHCDVRSTLRYKTVDGLAKAGERYEAKTGELVFGIGEFAHRICIKICESTHWQPELEFYIEMLDVTNAVIPSSRLRTSVSIIDNQWFPTDEYQEVFESQDSHAYEQLPALALFIEYGRQIMSIPVVRKGTIIRCLSDQVHNLHWLLNSLAFVFLVDKVLKAHQATEGTTTVSKVTYLSLVAVFGLALQAVDHFLNYYKLSYTLGGTVRVLFGAGLVNKFLNYNEESRAKVAPADLIQATAHDVLEVQSRGWNSVLGFVKSLCKIMMCLFYNFAVSYIFNRPFRPSLFVMLTFGPMLLVLFQRARHPATRRAVQGYQDTHKLWLSCITECVHDCELISLYGQSGPCVAQAEGIMRKFNKANRGLKQVMFNNIMFVKWVTEVFVTVFMYVGGLKVITGEMMVGLFLMDIRVLHTFGSAFEDIYVHLQHIESVLPALERVVFYMNLRTSHERRMTIHRWTKEQTQGQRKLLTASVRAGKHLDIKSRNWRDDVQDHIRIMLTDVVVRHDRFEMAQGTGRHLSTVRTCAASLRIPGSIDIAQGHYVVVTGGSNFGKTTVLRALSHTWLPEEGSGKCFVPSNLRKLFVPSEPIFTKSSIYHNIIFGCNHSDPQAALSRVRSIVEVLGVSESVLSELEKDTVLNWYKVLSLTDRHLLSIARALVANPTLLCLQKPTQALDSKHAKLVLLSLRNHVDHQGLCRRPGPAWTPRTCIITASSDDWFGLFDTVLHVTPSGIHNISRHETDVVESVKQEMVDSMGEEPVVHQDAAKPAQ